jgi:hypothetical protein
VSERRWRLAAWAVAAVMAASVSVSILAIPVQTTDALVPILQAQELPSVAAAIRASAGNEGYFRPLRIGQIQVLYEAANGQHFYAVYKGFHVFLVCALFACFVHVLRVRDGADFFAATIAMTALTGIHTFLGGVSEAYPVNHFLETSVLCLFALALARSHGGWWVDLLAGLTFVLAAGTLESGLIVGAVLAMAWLVGWRGVSWRGLLLVTLLGGAYAYLRFEILATGLPTLTERDSGFWTERLSPAQLQARFGKNPLPFYAYNVMSSLSSVLFAEPRAGVWAVPLQLTSEAGLTPGTLLNIGSSTVTTLLLLVTAARRVPAWLRLEFDDAGRLVLVVLAVIGANAAISYGYTKDEILNTAGIFYAAAAFAAIREMLRSVAGRPPYTVVTTFGQVAVVLVLFALGSGWVVRSAGLHYHMRHIAFDVQNEWVDVDAWLHEQHAEPKNAAQRRIVQVMRDDAMSRQVTNPFFFPRWGERWFQ